MLDLSIDHSRMSPTIRSVPQNTKLPQDQFLLQIAGI